MRSPTDISLAHLAHVPSHDDAGEGTSGGAGLAIQIRQDHTALPPPEYSSPAGSRRGSEDGGEEARLLGRMGPGTRSPPIPSYSDAVGEGEVRGMGREGERSRSGTV